MLFLRSLASLARIASLTLAVAALAIASTARAQPPPAAPLVPEIRAARVAKRPAIDGRLDDAAWKRAAPTSAFTQKVPESGRPPTDATTLRVLYDDDAIYVGFDCAQKAPIVARLARRDRSVQSDSVTIAIDSRHDGRSAFEFSVSAAGVQTDGTRFDDMDYSSDWDENWEAKTAKTARGWSAEIRVPLRILKYDASATTWGFQARRYSSSRQETDEWAFSPRDAGGEVSRYGRLVGLDLRSSHQGLELRPFVLGRLTYQDPDPTIGVHGLAWSGSAGGDLTWHPARDLTLNATINPDFAQVEADQLVLNLTNQEIFLPEKRPFFLDGADSFATPFTLLYTRRIGRVPLTPLLDTGEILYDRIGATPVYGAAKLTGSLGPWSVSTLAAVTGPSTVDILAPGGSRTTLPLEPTSGYGALRITRAIGPLRLGAMATSVTRAEAGSAPGWLPTAPPYPLLSERRSAPPMLRCPDGTTPIAGPSSRCTHDAYVGGLDWLWVSPGAEYSFRGQVLGSAIENGPERRMLDGTLIRSGDVAPAARVGFTKDGGEHWIGTFGLRAHGRKVDYDDLGYMPRQNELRAGGYVGYRTLEPWGPVLETETGLTIIAADNWDWLNLGRSAQAHTEIKWKNYWTSRFDAYAQAAYYDDREVGDGTALERAALGGLQESVGTDTRAPMSARIQLTEERVQGGAYNLRLDGDLRWLPVSTLELEIAPTATVASGEPRYAGPAYDGAATFATLTAYSAGATLRLNYTFSPKLSLQTYAQLFLASERFRGFVGLRDPVAGGRVNLASLVPAAAPPVDPDIQEGALDLSVILRWEYALGSTLYLVLARSEAPQPLLSFGEEPRLDALAVVRAPAADVFLVKLSYWFGM